MRKGAVASGALITLLTLWRGCCGIS